MEVHENIVRASADETDGAMPEAYIHLYVTARVCITGMSAQVLIVGNSQQTVVQLVYQGLADVGFVRTNQV